MSSAWARSCRAGRTGRFGELAKPVPIALLLILDFRALQKFFESRGILILGAQIFVQAMNGRQEFSQL